MLIGLRQQQNEREVRAKKSQIYKQMLDNQILMNEQYKKDKSREKDFDQSPQFYVPPSFVHKSTEPVENYHVRQNEVRQSRQKHRFLPLIKDKNTFYRGSSKFLKVDETAKPARSPKHVKTEQIDEEDEPQDGYNTTCERIIRQLQSISTKPVKFRNKKRLLDKSGGQLPSKQINSRNIPAQNKSLFEWLDKPIHSGSKPNKGQQYQTENRYSRFISADLNGIQKEPNQFDQSQVHEKEKHKKSDSFAEEVRNQFIEEDRKQNIKNRKQFESNPEAKGKNIDRGRNYDEDKTIPKISQFQSSKKGKEEGKASKNSNYQTQKLRKNVQTSNFQRSQSRRYNPSLTPVEGKRTQDRQSYQNAQKSKEKDQASKQHQERKQNFLQLLRKVKNRGESLYIKMAKYPSEKQIQHN